MTRLPAPQDRIDTMPEGVPELTVGWEALAWASKYLRHPNGLRAGKRWQFTREQARFVLWFYAVDKQGEWLFHRGVRRLSKGSGKSPFAAVMALVELLAPVRFDRFDSSAPGGVVGKPVAMPWVQIAAASKDQTENTFRHVRSMVSKHNAPALHRDYALDVGKTQVFVQPEGKLEVITASASTAEGAEVSFVIGDELEHWTPSNGGVELHNTLIDNLTKSGSRMLETLNAWKPGLQSAGEATFDTWVDQESGRLKAERKILYDARMAPADTDLADKDSLRAGLEFVYQDCPWALENIDATIDRIWTAANVADSKRKYLNWPTADQNSWADPQEFALLTDTSKTLVDGEEVVLFFDGSLSNDHTALIGCRMSDGHVFTLGVWEPEGGGDHEPGRVDVEAVDAAVEQAFDRFDVVAFFADVREWESFVKVTWPERYRDRLRVWATPGARHPEPIAWDMRGKDFEFTTAAELCEAEIRQRAFTHDGDPRLVAHVHNARRHMGRYGITVRKETPKSPRKIDAAVCMIGARMVWRLAREQVKDSVRPRSNEAFFLT